MRHFSATEEQEKMALDAQLIAPYRRAEHAVPATPEPVELR